MNLAQLTEDDVLAISERLAEPDWLRDRRLEAFKAFVDFDWPTNRDEAWRHTDPRRFDYTRPLLADAAAAGALRVGIVGHVGDRTAGAARIVDGAVVQATVCAEAQVDGAVVADLIAAARGDHGDVAAAAVREHLGAVAGSADKHDAAALAAFSAGVLILVPSGAEIADPITVTVQAAADGASVSRVLIVLGANAKATVYLDHAGDAATTVVDTCESVLDAGATLDLVTAQDWGTKVDHVATHRGRVGQSAIYRHLEITLGGRTVYVRPDVILDGTGGSALLLGVYFGSDEQRFEHRSLIHHVASHTISESVYKGALQDSSRATWFGNIRIEPDAKATISDETNRNLILSPGARADTIPFLEILTSDVAKCGHHSSVGQIDELALFYLESRGIPREEAARMLVFAFFADVLERIDLPGVRDVVMTELATEVTTGPGTLVDPRRAGRRSLPASAAADLAAAEA